jgi:hypothetical protein
MICFSPAVGRITPKNYSIVYNIVKICKIYYCLESVNVADVEHRPNCINMLHLIKESSEQYDSSNLNGYQVPT